MSKFGTVSNAASRLSDEAKPRQTLSNPHVSMNVENAGIGCVDPDSPDGNTAQRYSWTIIFSVTKAQRRTERNSVMSSSSSSADPTRLLSDLARETYIAERNDSATNPGPQNSGLVKLNPNSDVPPPTDHGVVEPFWYSFDLTHRR
jgi:hypothetical protein